MMETNDLARQKITIKPWLRPRYLEWRKEYEKSDKYLAKVRIYQAKRRANPNLKFAFSEYQRKYKDKHKIRILVRRAIHRAISGCVEFDREFLNSLSEKRPKYCVCCNVIFNYSSKGKGNLPGNTTPTLDRIDPKKGYIEGNVGIICWRCNALKRDGSIMELESIVKYMRERLT